MSLTPFLFPFLFSRISYNKIGEQIDKAVSSHVNGAAFEKAVAAIEKASKEANDKVSRAAKKTTEELAEISEGIQKNHDAVTKAIPAIHDTIAKLNGYEVQASEKAKNAENYLEKAKTLVPSLEQFSVHGAAGNGEEIVVPVGTVDDWSIIISPKQLGISYSGSSAKDTTLMSAEFAVTPATSTTWRVIANSKYKFGASVTTYPGEINFLLVPKSIRSDVSKTLTNE